MADVRSETELLPWITPITDGIVICKDSGLLAGFEFFGADADSVGEGEVFQVGQAAERMLEIFRDLPVTLWWTVRRERTEDYPGEPMPDEIAQMLDDEHRAQFLSGSAFVNRHFLSVLWRPEKTATGFFERLAGLMADGVPAWRALLEVGKAYTTGRNAFAWQAADFDRVMTEFEGKLAQAEAILYGLRPRRLVGQDFLGLLWAQANPGSTMVRKAWDGETLLDGYLPERPITVTRDALIFGDDDDAHFVSALSLKGWPPSVAFDAFGGLLSMPTEMVVSHCFRIQGTEEALKHINSVKRANDLLKYPLKAWLFAAVKGGEPGTNNVDPARAEAAADAHDAIGDLNSGRLLYGWHNVTVCFVSQDYDALESTTTQALRLLHGSGFVGATRESIHLLSGWASTLPGQWQECRRWLTISSANAVDAAPLLGVSSGERMNDHLTAQLGVPCQALTVMGTDVNTPFYFNFHAGALGHSLVVGPSRSGKSIGMNFLMSQFRKYPGARIIIFDKDFSCRQPTLLQGGEYVDLQPGSLLALNPLVLADDPRHWTFLAGWVESLIESRGYKVDANDAKLIHEAISSIGQSQDASLRRLLTLRALLPPSLGLHLDEWCGGGALAYAFDHVDDHFSVAGFTAFEMGKIMRDPRVARAFMEYAFYRIQLALEAQRTGDAGVTMVYVEEAWFLLSDARFASALKDWLKTFAKLNAFVVLCTQSIEDLADLPASVFAAIRDNIPTRIFLPNPMALSEGLNEVYRKQFELPQSLVERIATATPRQDYVIVKPDVARKVRLSLTPRQVAALRSDMAAQRVFERHYPPSPLTIDTWRMDYIRDITGE